MLNEEVTRQASFLAYINDYKILMIATLVAMPMLLLMRKQKQANSQQAKLEVLE